MSRRNENKRLKVLLLCDFNRNVAGTILDYVHSFKKYSKHAYSIRNGLGDSLAGVDLRPFDAIFVHWTLVASNDHFIAPATRRRIRAFGGYKAAFVQDDYRFIDRTVEALAYLRIHALFSLVADDSLDEVYSPEKLPGVKKVTMLAGYVPENLTGIATPPYSSRPIDVGYRARKLPAWMGSHTLQKWQIADRFAAQARQNRLAVDISTREEDRLYGRAWVEFITRCKAVLGTESGASVCDFTGQIQEKVENYTARHPDASFEELRDLFFKNEDNRLPIKVISPRCFEAAAFKTLMILYEGEYFGVLKPWKHYVPLRKDHGNMAEVLEVLRDPDRAARIIENAYEDIVSSGRYSYRSMVGRVDAVMEEGVRAWMLAANRPRRRVRQRIENFLRSLKAGPLVWGIFFEDPEIARLKYLQFFFLRNRDAELHLYLDPDEATLELVAVPSGSDPPPNARREIDGHELGRFLLSGKVRRLRWLNRDPLGLGAGPFLEEEFHFSKISLADKLVPGLIRDLVGARSPKIGWCRRVFVVDKPVGPEEAAGPRGERLAPHNPMREALELLFKRPLYGTWGRLPLGLRRILKPPLQQLLGREQK